MVSKIGMFFDNLNIRTTILIAILPLIFLTWGITTWISYKNLSTHAINIAGERLTLLGSESASNLSIQMEGYVHSLETLAMSPDIVNSVEESNLDELNEDLINRRDQDWLNKTPSIEPFIQSMLKNPVSLNLSKFTKIYPEEVEIIITGRNGVNVAISGRTSDYYQADETWWQNTYDSGKGNIFVGSPIFDDSIQKWVLIIGIPIHSDSSQAVTGVLRGTIDITSLIYSTSEIITGTSGYASLIGSDGTIYYTRDSNLILNQAPTRIQTLIESGKRRWLDNIEDLSGKLSVVSVTPISGKYLNLVGLNLLISEEQAEINTGIETTFLIQFIGSLIMTLILSLVCILIANNIGSGLNQLEVISDRLTQSDISLQSLEEIPGHLNLHRRDEIGKLTRAFYQMIISLQTSFASLGESENRFRLLTENIQIGIFVINTDSFLYTNQAINLILGYNDEDLTGKSIKSNIHPDDLSLFMDKMRVCCLSDDESSTRFECRWICRDGEIIDVDVSGTKIEFEYFPAFLGTLVNITDKKKAAENIRSFNAVLEQRVKERTQQLEIANQELEAFSYSVSHDLNAPLRRIIGFSRIILEDYASLLDESGIDYFNRICTSALRMEQLIQDLLRLSRVNRSEIKIGQVDLCVLAEDIFNGLKTQNPERVNTILEKPAQLIVQADENLMRIALENLLGNAWKYSSTNLESHIILGVEISNLGKTVYYVRDNGVGFDMAYSSRLFEAFQRLHNSREFSGNGIGLTLVKRIINRHTGEVSAEAQVTQGATFYFTLGC
ncbi:MAG: PAS domain S-box protein [Anaerolineae bacterium]|nr:PAS domain S-box protein [Anaerolineae bacterium]